MAWSFRVLGFGFWISDFGTRFWGSALKVDGLRFRVLWFRV